MFLSKIESIKNVFCLKLDAKSAPEALATSIRILLMFSIVLAHSRAQIPTFFLTLFVKIPSFFDNSFHLYPIGEKIDLADSEKTLFLKKHNFFAHRWAKG